MADQQADQVILDDQTSAPDQGVTQNRGSGGLIGLGEGETSTPQQGEVETEEGTSTPESASSESTPETTKPVILVNQAPRAFEIPPNFNFRAVDSTGLPGDDFEDAVADGFKPDPAPTREELGPLEIEVTTADEFEPHDDRRLGGLDEFVGNFVGNGLNIIFRPRNGDGMIARHDNLLEINVTREELQFLNRNILDAIPNRGFGGPGAGQVPAQRDLMLRGIPYMQRITDLIDQQTGELREPGVGIHFEQGLFLRTPPTERPNVPQATISRLASIPHGSTINAQCRDPGFAWIAGPPEIPERTAGPDANPAFVSKPLIDITPFFINTPDIGEPKPELRPPPGGGLGPPGRLAPFANMRPAVATRNRIPNRLRARPGTTDLPNLERLDAIQNFDNPVQTLRSYNATKNIIKHRTFEVNTHDKTLPGDGTSNIAFLQGNAPPGDPNTDANANAVRVTCRYWISVVAVELTVGPTAHSRVEVKPAGIEPIPEGVKYIHPTFVVPLKRPLKTARTFSVQYVQIQYAQNVTLDFGPLSWPHVSVASLIPAGLNMDGKVELYPEQLPEDMR